MFHALIIFLGGGLGAAARHGVGLLAMRHMGAAFPYGTLIVNIVGSLVMGLLIGWMVRRGHTSNEVRLFLATGFLGGFTTFSAFALDFANLWRNGETASAIGYVLASVMLSLLAVFAGLYIMRQAQV